MATEKQLRDVLIELLKHLQKQHSLTHSLLTEVAALRESLIEIGPRYDDILTRHRAKYRRETDPVLSEISSKYDAMIQKLMDDSLT